MAQTILIVDDSMTTRRLIRRTVELAELPVGSMDEAASGEEALQRLAKGGIDLVLADLNMPGMGGQGLIKAMGEDEALKGIPVVVVSSEGNEAVLESLNALGVKQVIRKPFHPGVLRSALDGLLASA
jgi:two-component system chemotaxis response regulator CheY